MGKSKERGLYSAVCLTVIVLALQAEGKGKHFNRNKYDFQDGVPKTASEAENILEKLIMPQSPLRPTGVSTLKTSHPLDPLTAFEIRTAALVIRSANRTTSFQYKCIGLKEPEKSLLAPYFLSGEIPPWGSIDRKAFVMVVEPKSLAPACVVVNLRTLKIESWTDARQDQHAPMITSDDDESVRDIVFSDSRVVKRINNLGFNDLSIIRAGTWESGYVADNPTYAGVRKLVQVYFNAFLGDNDNHHAHPLDFVAYVDVGRKVVVGIEDLPIHQDFDTSNRRGNSVPLRSSGNVFLSPSDYRQDVRPIVISRPEGTSFEIQDRLVSWQNFKLRVGYNPREGLVIHHVTYNDNGNDRPLFYRLSVSENFLYYGDPRPPYHRKSSYDEGNFELGTCAVSLSSDFCGGHAYYYDSVIHNDRAETTVVKKSTCVFEEDSGVLWAYKTGDRLAVTRSQRLSIRSYIPIGNSQYLLSWRFYQDATIELSIKLTGTIATNLMAVDVKAPLYGNLMGPQLYTQNFQYFIGARIDADIDGIQNTVAMEDFVSVPPPNNPYGNGIQTKSTVFSKAGDAPSDILPGRSWKVCNPNEVNPVTGRHSSWKLIPQGPNMPSLITPDSPLKEKRLQWADHNMWVLPFNDEQIFIDNIYLDCGVAKWTNESLSANIENTDVVLWHVFGFTFAPDPEDWPVVSAIPDTVGFKLRPSNFFVENPALRVPFASKTTAYDDQAGWSAQPPSPSPSAGWRN